MAGNTYCAVCKCSSCQTPFIEDFRVSHAMTAPFKINLANVLFCTLNQPAFCKLNHPDIQSNLQNLHNILAA
ncbi:hypothetical protein LMF89_25345 [Pelosinus sp. Bkl1]|uniref:Uncharacterized protein n=1 Tax=Pelosinus baikalensis TaxID=2892015 RepID=A0ABS8HZS0_9FIRM|nr:hypothetical protein [Pelosinus baikalensis]